jgi:hypothetical protein
MEFIIISILRGIMDIKDLISTVNLARIYKELIIARAALSEWEKSMVGM